MMIYIPHIKRRLDELVPRWNQKKLTPEELDEFYDLLDHVIIEARESRSDWVPENQRPEMYLLSLFEEKIKITLKRFFEGYGKRYLEKREIDLIMAEKVKLEETGVFYEWLEYARAITEAMILGDSADRQARAHRMKKYLDTTGINNKEGLSKKEFLFNRHLDANSKRLYSTKKRLLHNQDKSLGYNYEPWAEQCALNEGEGYNPNFKREMLQDLTIQKECGDDAVERWNSGELPDIKTRGELDDIIRQSYGALPEEVAIEIAKRKQRRPNVVSYLFGFGKRFKKEEKGQLYWRLVGLDRFQGSNREQTRKDYEEICNDKAREDFNSQDEDHEDSDGRLWELGLTKKQQVIFIKRIKEQMTARSIAEELRITERTVYKHLANIMQNPYIKNILRKK